MSQSYVLEVQHLALSRGGRKLLSAINFSLKPGSWLHVKGDNGSGKTSLLRVISCLAPADAGEIFWQGQKTVADKEEFLRNIHFLGHKLALKEELSPLENLLANCCVMGSPHSKDELVQALHLMGLKGREHTPLAHLSQGQKRRVALAGLRLSNALLWILDEPLVALDTPGVTLLLSLMNEHLKRGGAIILTSHQALELESSGSVLHLDNSSFPHKNLLSAQV